jgi:hypothetical protein
MNFEEDKYTTYNPIYEYTHIYPETNVKEYIKQISYNEYEFIDNSGNIKNGFKKFISLVDFVKFLIGKYKSEQLSILPSSDLEENGNLYRKYIKSHNNYAYVDAFFYNLTSSLKKKGFVHGIDVYDNYLCIKKNVEINIAEDFEYVVDSNYFNEKLNKLFYFKDESISSMFRKDNLKLKELNISDIEESIDTLNIEELDEIPTHLSEPINELEIEEIMMEEQNENETEDDEDNDSEISVTDDEYDDDKHKETENKKENKTENENNENNENESTQSSDFETTDDENEIDSDLDSNETESKNEDDEEIEESKDDEVSEENQESEENEEIDKTKSSKSNHSNSTSETSHISSNSSSHSEEESFDGSMNFDENQDDINELILVIKEMPTQVVFVEKCENTFDSLLETNITIEELESAMFQIIVILYTYQKVYQFTHNDLHTNNIMFITTNEPYLYYKIMGQNYKIPTFGKIYKIIDFGRAIYSINDKLICSDSFSVNGTAHTQYNFEPFYNPNKPILKPNYSFDLCRLACSMLDFIIDDLNDLDKFKTIPIYNLIISWIYDDSGNNILYKRNGEERYPDFKLYRMIARIVHNHLPEKQFSHECFEKYISTEENELIMNIDELIQN